jgi:glycosyltransferase involved in cell wall biosynthesis
MPKISVIIPVYNGAAYIADAIDSLLHQTMDDFEMIIVDDGSNDTTRSIIEQYREKHQNKIVYDYQEHSGVSKARNTGFRHAKGKYIAFLDSDDILFEEALSLRSRVLDTMTEVGVVFSDYIMDTDLKPVLSTRGFLEFFDTAVKKVEDRVYIFDPQYYYKFHSFSPFAICTNAIMLRSSVMRKFREDVSIAEDHDLWWYLVKRNTVAYVDFPLSCYRRSLSTLTRNEEMYYFDTIKVLKEMYQNEEDATTKRFIKIKIADKFFWLSCFYAKNRRRFLSIAYALKSILYTFNIKAIFLIIKQLLLLPINK